MAKYVLWVIILLEIPKQSPSFGARRRQWLAEWVRPNIRNTRDAMSIDMASRVFLERKYFSNPFKKSISIVFSANSGVNPSNIPPHSGPETAAFMQFAADEVRLFHFFTRQRKGNALLGICLNTVLLVIHIQQCGVFFTCYHEIQMKHQRDNSEQKQIDP